MSKNYGDFKAEDFLTDERFRRWVASSGQEEAEFWTDFQAQYPHKSGELRLARAMWASLHEMQDQPEPGLREKVWANVSGAIDEAEPESIAERPARPLYRWWMAAAAILIVGGLTWNFRRTFRDEPVVYREQVSVASVQLKETINATPKEQTIRLSDGSTVQLKPGSKLSYSSFPGNQRVVYLDGEGYFDVAKNPAKPFIVYAGRIVVQVVGTSFRVTSNTGKIKSKVTVMSGKVKVFAAGTVGKGKEPVFLVPNQQVVFDANTSVFAKGLVAQPVQVGGTGEAKEFYFDNTSVKDVLHTIEAAYGVTIRYDNAAFESCKLTAPLGDMPMFRKLDIICQTVGATYEVFGTEIVITGGACDL
ncbi:FecR family protein [Dyadobacter soli]|uniref:FecR family protein n=1 Tax=Dyadobacter soli TaxID=659014 RepID=A0A1G8ATB6_9BACT|nr:FecR family protein [Dyadobacter soli]SDH24179.1 FecR family protein [Dyadobacter soli]